MNIKDKMKVALDRAVLCRKRRIFWIEKNGIVEYRLSHPEPYEPFDVWKQRADKTWSRGNKTEWWNNANIRCE